ncbi:hypothetical protein QTP86_010535 [Hemibagrus guttatus]|nr:hypothetical protein QTP86_010535 [Hemibagrus guttatus]
MVAGGRIDSGCGGGLAFSNCLETVSALPFLDPERYVTKNSNLVKNNAYLAWREIKRLAFLRYSRLWWSRKRAKERERERYTYTLEKESERRSSEGEMEPRSEKRDPVSPKRLC